MAATPNQARAVGARCSGSSRLHWALDERLCRVFSDYDLGRGEFDVLATLRRSGAPFELTDGGRQLIDEALDQHVRNEAGLLSGLSATERRTLADLLRKLGQTLDRSVEEADGFSPSQ
ncbi:hypothetical protein [Microlunatus speluncae]|uniref:hypothetical protein n=1 Tax=Microlunatus speluncae TaxID=2594267 RepID=UPI0012663CDB|nr:hypothetical protein [Microlunatus speluncae]